MIGDVLGQLGFDWKVALANLVNFLIIYILLRNVVFKKIGDAIKERQEKIKQGLTDAELARTAMLKAEIEKEEILKESYKEARKIAEKAERDALILLEDSRKNAEKEAEKIKENVLKNAEKEQAETEKELKNHFVDLVISGVEKTAMQKVGRKDSEEFLNSMIREKQ